ncbi:SusC/RagA family TonB-linked outer membrane protein [Ferruginibacter sp. HRS2-29]|uniref:SusC/RagA family TonB-linked outer membrane protein n=1 Tax=Ferruginibacter sp. HRS2-29 TaxID=2487334 RepID=UPI0020CDCF08|nr:SusC/RagA family TonB-linked outer membrane protein [Ferruginibacter sp. HRS2-29]MCP9751414.1 SusC/RagA family TonB-linked outer membrane protein [Ferruginibacter sp. HRS2-29]
MRKILLLILFSGMLVLCSNPIYAQSPVSGIVTGENNSPLSGITVSVKGSSKATKTNESGAYTINASPGQTLVFSSVGFGTREAKVGSGAVNISLSRVNQQMEEVVVVAMDQKRNPKELGFSNQTVTGKEVAETQRENFLNGLQGRVAGLTINSTNGQAGASSSIVLRGFNSLALDNQPLFVIDGAIVDNQTTNETSNSGSGLGLVETSARNVNQTSNRTNDYTNRIADVNPTDIESITVLKGPEATALYGSQASSGAIIITTKRGKNTNGRVVVSYDNAFRWQHLSRYPEVNNDFDAGNNGNSSSVFTYFGPRYSDTTKKYSNAKNFFQEGFSQTHNISVDYGKKNASFRFSGSFFDQEGVIPENTFRKYNLRLSNSTNITKYVTITPAVSVIRSQNDKPRRGAGGYLLNLLIWPSDNDVRNYQNSDGGKNPLNFLSPNDDLDNPFFSVYNNRSQDKTDRLISTMGINIKPASWLEVAGRFSYDIYRSEGYSFYHPLSSLLTRGLGGSLDNYYKNYTGYNHTITATAKKNFGKFGARVMAGTMWQDYKTEMYSVYGTNLVDSIGSNGQMYKGGSIITNNAFASTISNNLEDSSITRASTRIRLNNANRKQEYNYSQLRQLAYFGEVSVNYDNLVFLTYSHRFENSSIFPKDYRKYNYPAASLSVIVSDIFPKMQKGGYVNYLKLRSSIANTARSSSPYANQSVFNTVTSSGGGYAYGFNNNNFFLTPERQKTFEIGTELRLFNNRLNLDFTVYNTLVKDQIAENFRSSYGTGFVLNTINVASTRNKGMEISMGFSPVVKKDFRWDVKFNFNKMKNKVLTLPANVPEFYVSDTWVYANARGGLVNGGPTTSITGYSYMRNNQGQVLINPADGLPVIDATFKVIGDRNPDFTLGTLNSFKYKNFSLNFLWDLKVGGDIFNGTDMYLTVNGKSKRTADRETPRVIEGVLNDGLQNTANPTKNTISVVPYNLQAYYVSRMAEEEFVEKNVNWFRLRDVTLTYQFNPEGLKKLRYFKSLGFFVTANDLILITNYSGADPASSSNNASTRGVGGWGFDYGNIATPISVNVGFRAGF